MPGRIGAAADAPYTLANYRELLDPAYLFYFYNTFLLSLIACAIGLLLSFPLACYIAFQRRRRTRLLLIAFLIVMMFLSALVRVYALELTFGHVGMTKVLAGMLGVPQNSRLLIELLVILGLLHYIIPMSTLTLIGTLQNISPALTEVAQSLGANRWRSHLAITLPLSIAGLISAFLISYTLCISAFIIPLVLGKGRVIFVSNLVYSRFSELANYPSGAAISVVMLVLSLIIFFGLSRVAMVRWRVADE